MVVERRSCVQGALLFPLPGEVLTYLSVLRHGHPGDKLRCCVVVVSELA